MGRKNTMVNATASIKKKASSSSSSVYRYDGFAQARASLHKCWWPKQGLQGRVAGEERSRSAEQHICCPVRVLGLPSPPWAACPPRLLPIWNAHPTHWELPSLRRAQPRHTPTPEVTRRPGTLGTAHQPGINGQSSTPSKEAQSPPSIPAKITERVRLCDWYKNDDTFMPSVANLV